MRQKYRWLRPPNRALAVTFALQSGPVFDDSMVRAILVEGIVDSIVMVDKRRIRERVGVGAFHSTQ